MKTDPIRILLADDHEIVRTGTRILLESEPGWKVCAEASDGREAVIEAEQTQPHVAVLDIGMPELNGLDAAREIKRVAPDTEILIFTSHQNEQLVRDVIEAGARGYLLKTDAQRFLVIAVKALLEHKTYFCAEVSEMIFSGYLKPRTSGAVEAEVERRLSPREREVTQLLCEGAINKEVGAKLGLSVKTIETHRKNIMSKLGLHSFSQLVVYALRNQLITG
jgi:DNA-binding NarL/FixJ family response regulator